VKVQDLIDEALAFEKRNRSKLDKAVMERMVRRVWNEGENATDRSSKRGNDVTPATVVRMMYNALLHPTWYV
jgi:hypothetical protein